MPKPAISVIIPALNEEKYIRNVFAGLKKQTFGNFETIVVDGGSRDRTREIARRYSRVIIENKRGIGRARNRGSRAARGEILVFLDADTEPNPGLLRAYLDAFKKEKNAVAATGPVLPLEKASKKIDLSFRFVSKLFVRSSILLHRPLIIGSNFAVRKDSFRIAGGFNDSFASYEDWDLSMRLGKLGKIVYVDSASVKASIRRIKAWGIIRFMLFYIDNAARHLVLKKPKDEYEPIR